MTEKPNFFKLGIFILAAVVLIVGGVVLFSSGAFAKKKAYFETYFSDTVQGLSEGSPVQLGGVKIGEVEKITFARTSYELPVDEQEISEYDQFIQVVCSAVEEQLPRRGVEGREDRMQLYIKKGLRLRLASNLITGQAYLEATFLDPNRFPAMEVPWTPDYPYLPSAPSALRSMQDSIDKILAKLQQVEFKEIADNLKDVLQRLDRAIEDMNLKDMSKKMIALVDELRSSNQELKSLLENPDPEKELDNIAVLIDQFNDVLEGLTRLSARQEPQIQETLENLRQLSENLNYMTESLKENPSGLLFSSPPPKKGE